MAEQFSYNPEEGREVQPKIGWVKEQLDGLHTDITQLKTAEVIAILDRAKEAQWTKDSPENSAQVVLAIQVTLKRLGIDPGVLDGTWGPQTSLGLRAFQEQYNAYMSPKTPLVVDGQPGPKSVEALLEVLEKVGEETEGSTEEKTTTAPTEGSEEDTATATQDAETAVDGGEKLSVEEGKALWTELNVLAEQYGVKLYGEESTEMNGYPCSDKWLQYGREVENILTYILQKVGEEVLREEIPLSINIASDDVDNQIGVKAVMVNWSQRWVVSNTELPENATVLEEVNELIAEGKAKKEIDNWATHIEKRWGTTAFSSLGSSNRLKSFSEINTIRQRITPALVEALQEMEQEVGKERLSQDFITAVGEEELEDFGDKEQIKGEIYRSMILKRGSTVPYIENLFLWGNVSAQEYGVSRLQQVYGSVETLIKAVEEELLTNEDLQGLSIVVGREGEEGLTRTSDNKTKLCIPIETSTKRMAKAIKKLRPEYDKRVKEEATATE